MSADLQPVPRLTIPRPRDGESVEDLWKHVMKLANLVNAQSNVISALKRQIAQLDGGTDSLNGFFPFKIYNLEDRLQSDANNADGNNWRRFRVRTGGVTAVAFDDSATWNQQDDLVAVNGTDGADSPDVETFLDDPADTTIFVPAGVERYYFWVRLNLGASAEPGNATTVISAQLYHGADIVTSQPGPDASWTTFPQPDPYHKLIGWVDTLTNQDQSLANIRQIARADMEFLEVNQYEVCVASGTKQSTMAGGVPS